MCLKLKASFLAFCFDFLQFFCKILCLMACYWRIKIAVCFALLTCGSVHSYATPIHAHHYQKEKSDNGVCVTGCNDSSSKQFRNLERSFDNIHRISFKNESLQKKLRRNFVSMQTLNRFQYRKSHSQRNEIPCVYPKK